MNKDILDVQNLVKWFPLHRGFISKASVFVKAVDGVSFQMKKGEILGLVGESGCGKSTLARLILHLLKPTSGIVYYNGNNIADLDSRRIKKLRKAMQIIFQDPYSSLNPRLSIGSTLSEALATHSISPKYELKTRVGQLLEAVGLNTFHARRYPHEFSSGQRQRIGIARALAVEPEFIICDEPVSALDVSIQAQILNLLMDLRQKYNLTYLFISHDLSVIRHISDRIAVMYLGKIVELGPVEKICSTPLHPYTEALMSSAPLPDPRNKRERIILKGDVPSPASLPAGCSFHPRCPQAFDACPVFTPTLSLGDPEHLVACLLYEGSWPDGCELRAGEKWTEKPQIRMTDNV